MGLAQSMGIEMLSERPYNTLQSLQAVDLKTSSWLLTLLQILPTKSSLTSCPEKGLLQPSMPYQGCPTLDQPNCCSSLRSGCVATFQFGHH